MLLSETDRERIAGVIARIEESTAGEIVVADVPTSDAYAEPRALAAGALAILGGLWTYESVPLAPAWAIFAGQAVVAALVWALAGWSPVLRRLLPASRLDAAVHARAQQLFLERGVTETRDRSGVLILVSEREHRVEILADRGIHERVGVEEWRRDVRDLADAIREGRAAQGVIEIVERIGAQLAEAFPPRPDDVNELSDSVVRSS
ncbi:MAG: TPM domain-containing protein [Proteobacteria bacterium]|nr:TPM domain-containing protein [Pseudomonadota bacterium]